MVQKLLNQINITMYNNFIINIKRDQIYNYDDNQQYIEDVNEDFLYEKEEFVSIFASKNMLKYNPDLLEENYDYD